MLEKGDNKKDRVLTRRTKRYWKKVTSKSVITHWQRIYWSVLPFRWTFSFYREKINCTDCFNRIKTTWAFIRSEVSGSSCHQDVGNENWAKLIDLVTDFLIAAYRHCFEHLYLRSLFQWPYLKSIYPKLSMKLSQAIYPFISAC